MNSIILYKWLIREGGLISNFDSEGIGLLERGREGGLIGRGA